MSHLEKNFHHLPEKLEDLNELEERDVIPLKRYVNKDN